MKIIKSFIIAAISLVYALSELYAQTGMFPGEDSLSIKTRKEICAAKRSWFGGVASISAPLLISGALLIEKGNDFQLLRNEYSPSFSCKLDNYLQFAPSVMLFAVKAAGIESRSDWKRMSLSYIISGVTMSLITTGLNYTVHAERPNSVDNRGFPSGHTALAFMGAHMISKEYGYDRPWLNACAYTIATATGILRILNNDHHIQDVTFGAGAGILSAEIGALFTRLIMKEKGIINSTSSGNFITGYPSIQMNYFTGFNKVFNKLPVNDFINLRVKPGVTAGIDATLSISPKWGAVLTGAVNSAHTEIKRERFSIVGPNLCWYTISASPQYTATLFDRSFIGFRVGAGYSGLLMRDSFDYNVGPTRGIVLNGGINYMYWLSGGFQFKLFTGLEKCLYENSKSNLFVITTGAAVCIDFGTI